MSKKRLIDANAIHYCAYDLDNYHSFNAVTQEEIEEMPTVDAVEVVHGRWTTRTVANWLYEEVCSVCGFCGCEEFNYCPNCGAKMDGGNEDG